MTHRTLAAGLTAALVLSTLTACGSSEASGATTLTVVAANYGTGPDDDSQHYWDRLARAYEARHPGITIDVKVYGWKDIDTKIAGLVKAGRAPDIAQGSMYADYAAHHQLYSADELLPIRTQADFIRQLAEEGEVHTTLYGLPFASSSRMFFCNKRLFRQAGITKPPQTWDDIKTDAQALKTIGVKVPYGLPLGPEEAEAEALIWMLGNKGGYTGLAGSYTLGSLANVQALQWVKNNLVSPGLTGPAAPAETNRQDVFRAFIAGDAGMVNGTPRLLAQAESAGIEVGVVSVPGRTDRFHQAFSVADWLMAFKRNHHRDQISDFLAYVYSPTNTLAFLDEYRMLPVTTSASDVMTRHQDWYKDLWPFVNQYKDLGAFIDQQPTTAYYPYDKPSWATVIGQLRKNLGKAVAPGGVPADVLEELQQQAAQLDAAPM